jgi:hypothetical protein
LATKHSVLIEWLRKAFRQPAPLIAICSRPLRAVMAGDAPGGGSRIGEPVRTCPLRSFEGGLPPIVHGQPLGISVEGEELGPAPPYSADPPSAGRHHYPGTRIVSVGRSQTSRYGMTRPVTALCAGCTTRSCAIQCWRSDAGVEQADRGCSMNQRMQRLDCGLAIFHGNKQIHRMR